MHKLREKIFQLSTTDYIRVDEFSVSKSKDSYQAIVVWSIGDSDCGKNEEYGLKMNILGMIIEEWETRQSCPGEPPLLPNSYDE